MHGMPNPKDVNKYSWQVSLGSLQMKDVLTTHECTPSIEAGLRKRQPICDAQAGPAGKRKSDSNVSSNNQSRVTHRYDDHNLIGSDEPNYVGGYSLSGLRPLRIGFNPHQQLSDNSRYNINKHYPSHYFWIRP
jgi:hypothetical protein